MLHAVIMAGGSGTRFWPASRRNLPKQLLDLTGGQTMIQATVSRLGEAIDAEHVMIVTNQSLVGAIREQLSELPAASIIGEPCKRDTAPCIGLAAMLIHRRDEDGTMVVMPADHVISPEENFQQAISYAAKLVDEQPERIVTFGIAPTYPAESFGYIERGNSIETASTEPTTVPTSTYQVVKFREKPKVEIAQQYLESRNFYWNSGIFIWKVSTILESLRNYEPEMHQHLKRIADAADSQDYPEILNREFTAIQGKSIDYAVMERAKEVVVVEAPFQWDDVGNWQSLARLQGTDESGNTIAAKHLGINTTGTIVRGSEDHLIATVGLKDCIVVHTPDATLVADKHDEESIRQVVKLLEERGWHDFL